MKLYVPALPFGRRGEMYIHETAKVVDIRTINAAHLLTDGILEVAGLNKNVVFEFPGRRKIFKNWILFTQLKN